MAQPYVGEIRMFAGNFAPAGWMFCEGQLLPISENETLFQLIGTTYGGDGEATFALPDLRGRIPIHQGNGFILAETGGAEEVTLTVNQIPAHTHPLLASTNDAGTSRTRRQTSSRQTARRSRSTSQDVPQRRTWLPSRSAPVGGSQPHTNFQPYLCVNFIISLFGIFPSPDLRRARMADPFVAEIRIFPFNFAPRAGRSATASSCRCRRTRPCSRCSARPTAATAKSNFALPDLQGSAPMHPGRGRACRLHDLGETGGLETVTLLESRDPAHTHALQASNAIRRARRCRRPDGARAIGRAPTSTRRPPPNLVADGAARPCRRPAATSRTTTCSRT